jgi:hypothetical protein
MESKNQLLFKLITYIIAFFVGAFALVWFFKNLNKSDENDVKVKEKTYCECYKWGENIQLKEIEALTKTSDDMKKAEDERDEWNTICSEKMNPTKMSDKMKLVEELKKCK